jgi:hypothetical protein
MASSLLLLFALVASLLSSVVLAQPASTPYKPGATVLLQCRDSAAQPFRDAVVCAGTGRPLSFAFGEDAFLSCRWLIATDEELTRVRRIIRRDAAWQCRVAMSADEAPHWVPLSLPLWGVDGTPTDDGGRLLNGGVDVAAGGDESEPHVHINHRFNFVFHTDQGRLLAATAYPVRDTHVYARVGDSVTLHGPVRWFHRHGYAPAAAAQRDVSAGSSMRAELASTTAKASAYVTIGLCVALTAAVVLIVATLAYTYVLKPRYIKRLLKAD